MIFQERLLESHRPAATGAAAFTVIRKLGPPLRDQNHVLSSDPCPENICLALGLFLHITHVGASHLKNLKDSRETGNVPFRFFFG